MNRKILFVDDEPNVLQSIQRSLRKQFELDTANGGEEALQMMDTNGGYAIIVSDMRMPGMNGVELLSAAKKKWPDTIRMMLTGNADQQTAVDAVNQGDVFRFLNKPCDANDLADAVNVGLRQHELITAEKELLEKTVRGSIKALADVLALTNPEVFGRTTRYKNRLGQLAEEMGIDDTWQLESAALLSQIGCVSLPEDLVRRKARGEKLSDDELAEFCTHTSVGADLLATIPRLEQIAEAVRHQEKNFDGSGYPRDAIKGTDIPLGARLLKIVVDFDAIESSDTKSEHAPGILKQFANHYDPEILAAFERILGRRSTMSEKTVEIPGLTDSMIIAEDLLTAQNVLLLAKGQETTLSARRHLQNFFAKGLIGESVQVLVPEV